MGVIRDFEQHLATTDLLSAVAVTKPEAYHVPWLRHPLNPDQGTGVYTASRA